MTNTSDECDLLVVGAGSTGHPATRRSSSIPPRVRSYGHADHQD